MAKTSLGVHWAHRVADLFPDGQLYVDLRGYHPSGSAMEPGEAARGFLAALGIAPQRIPMDLAQQTALYRGLLADKRILVVLDNAYDADQVRPLLPGAPGCFVLVTSRNQLSGLTAAEGAHPLVLDRFTPDEAREFLARRLDRDRATAEPEAVEEIVTGCARLPLALAIVAARAATHPDFPLAALAADLRRAGSGLDAFAGDPTIDVRAVFSWSYRVLSDQAARLFRLLGLHPSPDIAPPAATSLAGLPERQARVLLTELTRAHLLTEHTPGRYTIHDLLRAYATELTDIHDSAPDRRAALHRLFDHYLHAAHAANGLVYPARYPVTPPPAQPGVSLPDLGTRQEAAAWLVTEQPVLLAALHRAARDGFDVHAWQIAWSLQWFLDASGQTRIIVTVYQIALAAARRLVDPTGQALALRGLGFGWLTLGRYDQADRCMRESRALFRTVGDRVGEARAEVSIGSVYERQEQYHDAARHIRRALTLLRDSGDLAGQARALNNLAWLHARLEDPPAAVANAQRAIQASQEIGDPVNEAASWHTLGYSHHQAGRHAEAVPSYQRSLELCRNQGMLRYEAQALVSLADSHRAAGDAAAAQRALEEALDILDELDDPDAEQVRAQLATDPAA